MTEESFWDANKPVCQVLNYQPLTKRQERIAKLRSFDMSSPFFKPKANIPTNSLTAVFASKKAERYTVV